MSPAARAETLGVRWIIAAIAALMILPRLVA